MNKSFLFFPSEKFKSIQSFLLVLLVCFFVFLNPISVFAAPVCEADPTNQGDGSVSGTPGTIIYYQTTGNATAGTKTIPVTTTAGLAADDMILIIQMQGADINSTNTNSYGSGVAGTPASGVSGNLIAGRYEYATVASVTGTQITVKSNLINGYVRALGTISTGRRRYQVIRVPQYNNLTLTGNVTAPAWNGETGGVLPLDVASTLNFNGNTINLSAKGFRGGRGLVHTGITGYSNADYRNTASNTTTGAHGSKGEGLAGTSRYLFDGVAIVTSTSTYTYPNGSYAQGAPGNAGGGGTDGNPNNNDQNSGGGGGGNGGAGAKGGNSWSSNLAVGGWGGAAFASAANRIVMGGGGGAATGNNATTLGPHGGVGGGIVLIRANVLQGTGTINVNGGNGTSPIATNDGGGGGGAGGSVILIANSQVGSITVTARGGNGGNADPGGATHGPGGGGGGGAVLHNPLISPTVDVAQGASGYTVTAGNYYGASPSGGATGSGVPNTDPNVIDGTGGGANCITRSDLSIVKTRSSGLMNAGSTAQFQSVVSNIGPDPTSVNIIVTDVLDSRFTYTGFTGTGWNCVQAPAQTITCTHAGPLAASASLPNLFINANISSVASGAVSNTATVALQTSTTNKDIVSGNNSSTINDTIYAPISGNKNLYLYPTSATAGTVQRVAPVSNATQTIERGNGAGYYMDLTLSPALQSNLIINNDILLYLCLRRESGNSNRNVIASLRKASDNSLIGAVSATYTTSNSAWHWQTFTMTHTGPTTITPGENLRLRIVNSGTNSTNNDIGVTSNGAGTNCTGSASGASSSASHVSLSTSTVINVNTPQVYNAASPSGVLIANTVESATVYVRATITDPFGFADINNNTTLTVLDNTNTPIVGPINDTAILSSSGNSKVFEYAVTMPNERLNGPFTLQVRGNEGTEGTVTHYGATLFTLTEPPFLVVSKMSSKSATGASPGEDIDYQVVVSNTSILGTGDATTVIVTDVLPLSTSFKIGTILYTNPYAPYVASGLSIASIEYFNGVTWAHVPQSGLGGVPAGYDGTIQQFRVTFSGIMPPDGGFALSYVLRLD